MKFAKLPPNVARDISELTNALAANLEQLERISKIFAERRILTLRKADSDQTIGEVIREASISEGSIKIVACVPSIGL